MESEGYVDELGWLEAWGTSLIGAMEALHALAAQRVAELTASTHTNVAVTGQSRPTPPLPIWGVMPTRELLACSSQGNCHAGLRT
jgi:hypothetical protein